MNNKVTVRDVARQAGVSVATVSYVMNNRTDQKISPETKKKVLQIANLLNYRPSHAAKSLATGRNNIIGIAYSPMATSPSRNMEIMNFANLLIERLNRMKYDVLFVPFEAEDGTALTNHNIDAIIAIDLPHDEFLAMADRYLIPVIAVEMILNNWLFYQIYGDYPSMIKQAADGFDDYYLVLDKFANAAFSEFVTKDIPSDRIVFFSENATGELKKLRNKNVVILGSYLALIVLPHLDKKRISVITSSEKDITLPPDIKVVYNDISKKANVTINVVLNSLVRNFELEHDLKIL